MDNMIYSVYYEELAGRIKHFDMIKYLNDLGWNQIQSKREKINIFQLKNSNGIFQADIPISRDLRDYQAAMYRNVLCIAEALHKTVEQVILELLNPSSDFLRFRINEPAIEGGSIFVEDAISLYNNAKRLLMATAMDIFRPQLWHAGRQEKSAVEFVNKCKFGQTAVGSYIVYVVCPIFKFDIENQIVTSPLFSVEDECSQPLSRQIINKLISSVEIVKNAIAQQSLDNIIHTNAYSEQCISANFLEALSSINIFRNNSTLDITAQSDPTVKHNTLSTASVSIDHDYFSPIDTFVRKVKSFQGSEKCYIGQIKTCHAPPDLAHRTEGKITLVFLDGTKKTTASATLSREDYDVAVEAHRHGKTVKLTGVMTKQSGRKKIDYSSFETIV
jgi:hypothetical protein